MSATKVIYAYWTIRRQTNSRSDNIADWSTRGLVNSPTAKITLCNTLQPELKPNPNPIDY